MSIVAVKEFGNYTYVDDGVLPPAVGGRGWLGAVAHYQTLAIVLIYSFIV